METLKTNLETQEKELNTKIREIGDKQAEVQQLQDQIQSTETILQIENREFERSRVAPVQPSSSLWRIVSRQKSQDEQQRREEAENRVQTLEEEVESLTAEVQKLKQEKQKSNNELQNKLEIKTKEVEMLKKEKQKSEDDKKKLQNELQTRTKEVESLTAEVEKLKEEKQKSEDDKKKQQKELVTRTKEQVQEFESSQFKQQDETSSASQSSTGHVVEVGVNASRNYLFLRNLSNEDQELGGWTLKVQINDKEPISWIFEEPYTLGRGKNLTMGGPKCDDYFPPDLMWEDLKPWSSGDKLQVFLFSNTGERQNPKVLIH